MYTLNHSQELAASIYHVTNVRNRTSPESGANLDTYEEREEISTGFTAVCGCLSVKGVVVLTT